MTSPMGEAILLQDLVPVVVVAVQSDDVAVRMEEHQVGERGVGFPFEALAQLVLGGLVCSEHVGEVGRYDDRAMAVRLCLLLDVPTCTGLGVTGQLLTDQHRWPVGVEASDVGPGQAEALRATQPHELEAVSY